jgi:hypothetical protein
MKKDKIVFQVSYKDNDMDALERKNLALAIPEAGKVRILKAGKHESGDEMYVIELSNLKPLKK